MGSGRQASPPEGAATASVVKIVRQLPLNALPLNVVRVLDVCKSSGVQEPYLDTVME